MGLHVCTALSTPPFIHQHWQYTGSGSTSTYPQKVSFIAHYTRAIVSMLFSLQLQENFMNFWLLKNGAMHLYSSITGPLMQGMSDTVVRMHMFCNYRYYDFRNYHFVKQIVSGGNAEKVGFRMVTGKHVVLPKRVPWVWVRFRFLAHRDTPHTCAVVSQVLANLL